MLNLKIKNTLRLIIALILALKPRKKLNNKFSLYCNLIAKNKVGGPDRFLKTILSNSSVTDKIEVSNWNLKNCKTALVFSASWGNSFALLAKLFKVKTVLRVDGFYVPEDKIDEEYQHTKSYRNSINEQLKFDLQNFDHIIYQSHFSKSICDKHLFKRQDNFSIIMNGTNTAHFKPIPFVKNKKIKLLILGKHYPKHLSLAVKILKVVLQKNDAELNIIGPMRDGRDIVRDFIQNMKIEEKIRSKIKCHGIVYYNELAQKIQSCDILLHVKIGDWCPNAAIEAMACGLPVVTPAWGGTKELVGDSGIAIEGPEWDYDNDFVNNMANAILKIYNDLETYRAKARERVEDNFDIKDISKKYLNVLEIH